MSTAELAVSYAALILADDGVEITVRSPASLGFTSAISPICEGSGGIGVLTGSFCDFLGRQAPDHPEGRQRAGG